MSELFTSLPRHLYVHVDRTFVSSHDGFEPAAWFGLTSIPGRAWGLSLLLESGAIYSQVPPHAISFVSPAACSWTLSLAQMWDCFGVSFALHEYTHLAGRVVECWLPKGSRAKLKRGRYLFTAQHHGDGYSEAPEQAKQFHFIQLDNGRLTALPANRFVVHAPEFTRVAGLPSGLRRQTETYECEGGHGAE